MARIVLDSVTRTFRHRAGVTSALRNVHLEIDSGKTLAVVGPSASGKTTLLRLIAGLDAPTEGEILIADKPMRNVPPHERNIAMVFQSGALLPHMTARENLALGLKLRKVSKAESAERVAEAARFLGLEDCLDRFPFQLSTGQRQRVALGRAMVRRPAIFLFDEPLTNLDSPLRAELRNEIVRLQQRLGATMIYVTHDQAEALSLGDQVAVLHEGTVEQIAKPDVIYQRPANIFVAEFIGSPPMNLLSGTLTNENGRLTFVEQPSGIHLPLDEQHAKAFASRTGQPVVLGLRPEALAIDDIHGPAHFEMTIDRIEHTGPDLYFHGRTAAHSVIIHAAPGTDLRSTGRVTVSATMLRARFFDPRTTAAITD